MNLYEIVLPREYNDGQPVEPEKIDQTLLELTEKFGGVEFFDQPFTGYWRWEGTTFEDVNVLIRVETSEHDGEFWVIYKETLKQRFQQEEIRIRRSPVDIL